MKVLFVASEAVPFAKSGGLGDVAGSLPRYLRQNNVDVRVLVPKYQGIAPEYQKEMLHLASCTVPVSWRRQYAGIEYLQYRGVPFYFLDNEYYFKRDGYYGYFDDAERFAFFSRAALEVLPALEFWPDIIHCHDWQTALVPLYLKEFYRHIQAKTLFTIHNLKYQGRYTHWILHNILGLGDAYFTADRLEFYGEVNLLKAGIIWCDALNTVSPAYAREIRYPYYGEGLDALLRAQEHKLSGILNGLDYAEYDPDADSRLYARYQDTAAGKAKNKAGLQEELGLPIQPGTPLLAMVTRLTAQKGLDLLLHIADELLGQDIQLVITGAGDKYYEDLLAELASRHPEKFRLKLSFEEGMARKVYAAADIFLMPSLYEPCGLGQLIAMRYGAVPVVRATGGLKDTVRTFHEASGEGNGFCFNDYNAHAFLFTVKKALQVYRQPGKWNRLAEEARGADFGWENSARAYLEMYSRLLQ